MSVTAKQVGELREKTGAGMLDCKNALTECGGDFEKAIEHLRKKGVASAAKKSGRSTKEGVVESYIHSGRIGVLIEVNCETDFVARNEKFQSLVKDLAMQIAAANPTYVSPEHIPAAVIEKEKEIAIAQMKDAASKPKEMLDKIAEGKIKKFYEDTCLMKQVYIKDPQKKVEDLITEAIVTIGENIAIRRFARFAVGEDIGAPSSSPVEE